MQENDIITRLVPQIKEHLSDAIEEVKDALAEFISENEIQNLNISDQPNSQFLNISVWLNFEEDDDSIFLLGIDIERISFIETSTNLPQPIDNYDIHVLPFKFSSGTAKLNLNAGELHLDSIVQINANPALTQKLKEYNVWNNF